MNPNGSNTHRIGISGGTFDPIHIGHLISAEHVREKFNLEKIVFVTAGAPPHKDLSLISEFVHRHAMVNAAVSGNPFFEASDMEIGREGLSYTFDTLLELRSKYGDCSLYFIIGADVIKDIKAWKNPSGIFSLCEIIALMRPGYSNSGFLNNIRMLRNSYNAVVHLAEAPLVNISSTEIRKMVHDGASIKYLVPEPVEDYIRINGLYRQ